MRRRTLYVLAVITASLVPAFASARNGSRDVALAAPQPAPETMDGIRYHDRRYRSVLDAPASEMRHALHEAYRLRPDRRFLLAFTYVHVILTGEPEQLVDVDYRDGGWEVRYGDRVAATLDELADFPSAKAALVEWANQLGARGDRFSPRDRSELQDARASLATLSVKDLMDGLKRLDDEWRAARDPAVLALAADGLVRLALQSPDPLELNDRLHARALATLAVLEAMSAGEGARDETLLASLMGYSTHAAGRAQALPPNDVVALHAQRDYTALRAQAERSGSGALARRLHLLSLAVSANFVEWAAWVDRYEPGSAYDLSVLRSAFALQDFTADHIVSRTVPYLVLREAWRVTGSPQIPDSAKGAVYSSARLMELLERSQRISHHDPAELLGEFEATLDSLPLDTAGVFTDRRLGRDLLRSFMYGAFYSYAGFVMDSRGSVEETEQFVASLRQAPPGPGVELYRWHEALAPSVGGRSTADALIATIAARRVGGAALARAFDQLASQSAYGATEMAEGARYLARRLDSRPAHLALFAQVANERLRDQRLAEVYYAHLDSVAHAAYPSAAAWHRHLAGDVAGLESLLADATLSTSSRTGALRYLSRSADPVRVEERYRALLAEDPSDWTRRTELVAFLERRGRRDDAVSVVEDWLVQFDPHKGFDSVFARTTLARLLEEEGSIEEAWTAIEDAAVSGQGGAMSRAARILALLGQFDEAEALALVLTRAYPNAPYAHARLAEVRWMRGDTTGAAEAVAQAERRLGLSVMRTEIASSFAATFAKQPAATVLRVRSVLLEAGVSAWGVREIASALAQRDLHDHAFALTADLQTGHPLGNIEVRLLAYRSLREMQGDSNARAWLQERIVPGLRDPASMLLYRSAEYELLWDLIPDPHPASASSVWLYRAAAATRQGLDTHPRRQKLLQHYSHPARDAYDVMGRYLVGLASEQELFAIATTPERRCEAAYYLALRALAEGRRDDASDWLRVVVETGLGEEGEYVWATDLLLLFSQQNRWLDRLEL